MPKHSSIQITANLLRRSLSMLSTLSSESEICKWVCVTVHELLMFGVLVFIVRPFHNNGNNNSVGADELLSQVENKSSSACHQLYSDHFLSHS